MSLGTYTAYLTPKYRESKTLEAFCNIFLDFL